MTHKCCIQNKHLLPQSGRQFVALANAADVANISLHLLTLVRLTSSPMLIIVMLTRAVQYAGFILKNSAIFTVFFFQTGKTLRSLRKHREHVIPTELHYWLTNLVKNWNQLLHRRKEINSGPDKCFK